MARAFGRIIGAIGVAAVSVAASAPLRADRIETKPRELENVDIDEHLDARLPLDLTFRDETGRQVRLGDYFKAGKPVVLSLNYSNCPMLCSLQLTGLTESLRRLEWTAGGEFQVVSVSIDPTEKPARAAETRQKYMRLYGRGEDGWHFLVGREPAIRSLADAVGFRYHYVAARNEYAHAATAILCTPDGRVSRYLYGIDFPEQTVRLSLVEASEGKIGSAGDQFLLFCFHYDPATGTYAPRAARLVMSVAGCVTVLALGGGILALRLRESSGPPAPPLTDMKTSGLAAT